MVGIARLHVVAFESKPNEEVIDVWGKETLDITWSETTPTFSMKGSGRFMFPFNSKLCSPTVFLRLEGESNYNTEIARGTYKGVIIGTCK
jgi:hypothetical protein